MVSHYFTILMEKWIPIQLRNENYYNQISLKGWKKRIFKAAKYIINVPSQMSGNGKIGRFLKKKIKNTNLFLSFFFVEFLRTTSFIIIRYLYFLISHLILLFYSAKTKGSLNFLNVCLNILFVSLVFLLRLLQNSYLLVHWKEYSKSQSEVS